MEYNYQNSIDDFRVKYTLVTQEENGFEKQTSEDEALFMKELEDVYADIERLTNQADGYDYALAISSGIIAGLIDSFMVGEWNFARAKKESNIAINKKIIEFTKKDVRYIPWCEGTGKSSRWIKRDPDRLASAVEFLEEKYRLPGDNDWNFKGSGISAASHHLDDFCHHPTLMGMISCILVQFTGSAKYHTSTGKNIKMSLLEVNEYGHFVSDKTYGKVFAGIINWFFIAAQTLKNRKGHLMSDMAGSIGAVKGLKSGAGLPGTIMSMLKELSTLPCINELDFAENIRRAYQNGIGRDGKKLDLGIFNNLFEGASSKADIRTEFAVKSELKRQTVPVVVNEIVVRAFYFIRRFIEEMKEKSIAELEWKTLMPMNNRTIVRMLTIASGTFCAVDLGDATIRSAVKSGGNAQVFFSKFILRVNFVGIGRFTIAVGSDLYMEARKGRLEIAVASAEVACAALKEKKIVEETSRISQETDIKINIMKRESEKLDRFI
mgnify:FL=1